LKKNISWPTRIGFESNQNETIILMVHANFDLNQIKI